MGKIQVLSGAQRTSYLLADSALSLLFSNAHSGGSPNKASLASDIGTD